MKKNIIKKSFIICLIAVMVMFIASTYVMYWMSRDNIKKKLVSDAAFYADVVEAAGLNSLLGLVYRGDMRITVVKPDGTVVYESGKSESLDNHANREEVKSALNGNPKIVERYSETLGQRMFYYALVTGTGGEDVVVRLAVSAGEVWTFFLKSLPFAALAMAIAMVASYLFSKKLSAEVTGQIKNIEQSLRSFNEGKYIGISATMADKEIFSLVEEIDRLVKNADKQRVRVEAEEAKLDYVVSHLNEGIIALNKKGAIVLLNNAANRMFKGDGRAKNLGYLIDDNLLLERLTELNKNAKSETFPHLMDKRDYVFSVQSRQDASAEVRTMVFIADVTKERLAVRERGEFFQNASHELKTPLTSIEGLSELILQKEELSPQIKKFTERINGEARRMAGLVQDMLYISDLENSRRQDEKEIVDLSVLAKELFENYHAEAEAKNLSFSIEGEANLFINRRNMAELLGNLVGNAVHYNKNGGTVTVNLKETQETVRVKVKDTGIGIAEKDLSRITERFYRVDKSRSKETGGTGLGLAIVKHIAERYKGDLTVESKVNVGTTVTVMFYKRQLEAGRRGDES